MQVIDGKIYLEVHEMRSDFNKEVKDQVGSGQFGLRLLIFKLKCTFTFLNFLANYFFSPTLLLLCI